MSEAFAASAEGPTAIPVLSAEALMQADDATDLPDPDEAHAPARATYRKVGFDREAPSVTLYQDL